MDSSRSSFLTTRSIEADVYPYALFFAQGAALTKASPQRAWKVPRGDRKPPRRGRSASSILTVEEFGAGEWTQTRVTSLGVGSPKAFTARGYAPWSPLRFWYGLY